MSDKTIKPNDHTNRNNIVLMQIHYPTRMKLWNPSVDIYNKSAEINFNLLIRAIEYVEYVESK